MSWDPKRRKRKAEPVKKAKPQKYVRIDSRTVIEVDFDIHDDVARTMYFKKLERSTQIHKKNVDNTKKPSIFDPEP